MFGSGGTFKKRFGVPMKKARKLGEGKYGQVFLVADPKAKGQLRAVKIVKKSKLTHFEDRTFMQNEIKIHTSLNHPNIVQMFECLSDKTAFYLVLECMGGGELFDRIVAEGSFSEKKAAVVVKRVAEALVYLHEQSIVHRDLKPENLLLSDKDSDTQVKLADFGFATYATQPLSAGCGTIIYIAPEILRGERYKTEIDVWSLGIILYSLLSGYPPFYADDDAAMAKRIVHSRLGFLPEDWDKISGQGKDLVKRMLERDQKTRLTAKQVLEHEWFARQEESEDVELSAIAEKMKEFKAKELLRRAMHGLNAMNKLTSMMSELPDDDNGETEVVAVNTEIAMQAALQTQKTVSSQKDI